jgi:hypothetical protein
MDTPRFEEWVRASVAFGGPDDVSAHFATFVQGLGWLDCELLGAELRWGELDAESRVSIAESTRLSQQLTLSHLWVLGAYEVVRTVDQWCRESPGRFGAALGARMHSLKLRFERVRIPLAKFEAAHRHPGDSPVAYSGVSERQGVAWQLGPDLWVSRWELSDELLAVVKEFRAYRDSDRIDGSEPRIPAEGGGADA